ncbi:MAG TPA: flavin reductase [Mycobacteriales bacterium]|nr:flavin reductase [Mycobacteriales bacterium]
MSEGAADPLSPAPFDPKRFRTVLGNFPTGVAIITGLDADGQPAGLAIGSFSSVSLDPPLVGFMPDKNSSSWPKFRDSGHFCVNILGSDQETVCRTFAVSGGDKFADLGWRPAGSGSPILDDVLAWIDCDLEAIHEAGDHYIVLGRVRDLDTGARTLPLVFFQGGYGRFSSLSLAAYESGLILQMRSADLARPHMEELAEELQVECVASAVVGEEMVLVARAGSLREHTLPTAVGQRIPLEPPMGTAFIAWGPQTMRDEWFGRLGSDYSHEAVQALEQTLAAVRSAGYSVGRGHRFHSQAAKVLSRTPPERHDEETTEQMHTLIRSLPADMESPQVEDSEVRTVSTPVFGPLGEVVLVLSVTVAGQRTLAADLEWTVGRLRAAAIAVTQELGGTMPEGELG